MMMNEFGPPPSAQNPFMACNQGIANGFGAMFYNMRDPNQQKSNIPVKVGASFHLAVFVASLILAGGIIVGALGFNAFLTLGGVVGVMVGGFVIYLILSIFCSDIRGYISNIKAFSDYKKTFDNMVQGRGYFVFWIQCYHYRTVRTKNGTRREKVVTHTATSQFNPRESVDESGQVVGIEQVSRYVFINYLKRFYFTDDASQNNFVMAFNNFVNSNRRDEYQNYSHSFEIRGFEENVAFTAMGEGQCNVILFYLFTCFGLGLPYACILERAVSRYEIGILKRLTV